MLGLKCLLEVSRNIEEKFNPPTLPRLPVECSWEALGHSRFHMLLSPTLPGSKGGVHLWCVYESVLEVYPGVRFVSASWM